MTVDTDAPGLAPATPPESAHDPAVGSPLLPGLLAWELLGGGTYCETWLCWSTELWAPVAVKLPRPDYLDDADTWSDLRCEALNHELVRHPGFQRLWSSDLEGTAPHLVLEYVEGPTLATLADRGALTVPDVALVGMQLLTSLRHLHRRGLVHLDVKPSNVVVRDGRAVLLDLGIATPAKRVVADSAAPGTVPYLAPEVRETGAVSTAADMYALGMTLQELLSPRAADHAVARLAARLTSTDPGDRPEAETALRALSLALPPSSPGLWPPWVTSALVEPRPR